MQCINDVCGTWGVPCSFGHESNPTYHCVCKDNTDATGDENNLYCPDINECHLTQYNEHDMAITFAGTDVSGTGISVFMNRPACLRCVDTGFFPTSDCTFTYDAGYVCRNNDVNADVNSFDCSCPHGSTLVRYTNEYLSRIDEENDQEVNGIVNADAMVGWTQPSDGVIDIAFSVTQNGVNGGTLTGTTFQANFDSVTGTWSSDVPLQCVEYERCPTVQCPNRSAVNIGCTDNTVYGDSTHETYTSGRGTFWDFDDQDTAVIDGVTEGLPTCDTCDNALLEFDEEKFTCVDTDECAAISQANYDAMLADGANFATSAYAVAIASLCGVSAPSTAVPSGWSGNHFAAGCNNMEYHNSEDGYTCVCPDGSELASDGSTCVDIDECATGAHTCGNQQCINYCFHGSSDGVTPPGVVLGDGTCSFDTTTTATYGKPGGGFSCWCPDGLEWDHSINDCVDIDECATGAHTCDGNVGAECVNAHGAFYCSCKTGFFDEIVMSQFLQDDGSYMNPADCTNAVECDKTIAALNPGGAYCATGSCSCTAGNECSMSCYDGLGNLASGAIIGNNCNECHSNGLCTQLSEGYECSCPVNSAHDGIEKCDDGEQCGEGLIGTETCEAQNLACVEQDISFTCDCPVDSGYELNGANECVDINECDTSTPCGTNGNCENTDGGYDCTCFAGFELTVPGRTLTALPQSAMKSLRTSGFGGRAPSGIVQDNWQVFAINQEASVSRTGERTDQFTCTDVDECLNGMHVCEDVGGICANADGTHFCTCAEGFTGDGYSTEKYTALNAVEGFVAPGGTNPAGYTGCTDIDECQISDICGPGVSCTNTEGSFFCGDEDPIGPDGPGGTDPTNPTGGTDPTENCAGLGGICDHAACDDEVEWDCGRTVCNMSCKNGEAINVSSVTCVDTGKLKKQGWRVGKKVCL